MEKFENWLKLYDFLSECLGYVPNITKIDVLHSLLCELYNTHKSDSKFCKVKLTMFCNDAIPDFTFVLYHNWNRIEIESVKHSTDEIITLKY